ncbi:MAG TPA: hypothetical protein VGT41_06255 [Candidatus Babeliales bacterium]|nr:hypothetical protein [Candidatus Babeliales bacterium]
MKRLFDRKSLLFAVGVLLVSGGCITAQVPKNLNEAVHMLLKDSTIWNRGNLLLSVGLPSDSEYQERKRLMNTVFNGLGQYVTKADKALKPQFDELRRINDELFECMTFVYSQYLQQHIYGEQERASGIIVVQNDEIIKKIDVKKIRIGDVTSRVREFREEWDIEPPMLQGAATGSDAIVDMRAKLRWVLKDYRKSWFINKKRGDVVECLLYLADRIDDHIRKFITDYRQIIMLFSKINRPQTPPPVRPIKEVVDDSEQNKNEGK